MDFPTARGLYDYPTAHIRCDEATKLFENYIFIRPLEKTKEQNIFESTFELDEYHNNLLTSDDDKDILIGISSVQYWGTYYNKKQPNHGLAFSRVQRMHEGNARSKKSIKNIGEKTITEYVRNSIHLINEEKYGKALSEITKIPWLSRSFGSKVLSFINPEKIGVYDIHISRFLDKPELEMMSTGKMTKKAEKVFDNFCLSIQDKAEKLNSSQNNEWIDWDEKRYFWRAVDVERAMFQLATK